MKDFKRYLEIIQEMNQTGDADILSKIMFDSILKERNEIPDKIKRLLSSENNISISGNGDVLSIKHDNKNINIILYKEDVPEYDIYKLVFYSENEILHISEEVEGHLDQIDEIKNFLEMDIEKKELKKIADEYFKQDRLLSNFFYSSNSQNDF